LKGVPMRITALPAMIARIETLNNLIGSFAFF
jgi:hypothetical protein